MSRTTSPNSVRTKVLLLEVDQSVSFNEKSPASIAVTISQTKKEPGQENKKYKIKTEGSVTNVTRVF